MLEALKTFMRRLGAEEKQRHFSDDDARLALAALLVHCTSVDGSVSPAEQRKLSELLTRTFGVTGDDLDLLLQDAIVADREAVDLYRFTSQLNRSLDEDGRRKIVEMMWEMVYADGRATEFEDNLLWRAADLLGISSHDRIALRQRVGGERSGPVDA